MMERYAAVVKPLKSTQNEVIACKGGKEIKTLHCTKNVNIFVDTVIAYISLIYPLYINNNNNNQSIVSEMVKSL